MYITAMWLRSPRKERGVNVYVHWHESGLPTNRWEIANNPGSDARDLRRTELRPGGNGVEAYVDIVLEDEEDTHERVVQALAQMAGSIDTDTSNLVNHEFNIEDDHRVGVRFSINNLMADRETKQAVYSLLRTTLVNHLRERVPMLPDAADRRPAQGAGT
jgi:hypothetical protein